MALYNADINVSGTITAPSGIFSDSVTVSGAAVLTSDSVVGGGGSALTVKEVDGDPSVANVDTIVVSNDTLTDDGGGQVTISIGAGGGSGGLGQVAVTGTVWNPFLAPASGTIYDDEFIEGTVISGSEAWGGWEVWDPGSTALNIETFPEGGGLRLRKTSTSDDIEFMGIYKPIPTESLWEAVTFVHFGSPGSLSGPDSMYMGFAFFDDVAGNPSTTDFIFMGIVMDSVGYSMTRALFSDYDDNTPASTSIDTDGGNISPNGVFLRATARDGNNNSFDLAYSYDGFGWKAFSFYTFPFTVNEIGLVCSNALTTSVMNFGARFFRIDPNFGGISRRGFPLLGNYMDPTGGGGSSFDPSSDQTITGEWDFTNSLTVSGVPVNIGAGGGAASTLQEAYDNGDGTISTTGGKPLELTGTGELVAVTGTFTGGLTVGTGSTVINDHEITTATGTFNEITLNGTAISVNPVPGYRGARVFTSSGISLDDGVTALNGDGRLPFDSIIFDTDGFFDTANEGRFVIPAGINKVEVTYSVSFSADIDGDRVAFLSKNGATAGSTRVGPALDGVDTRLQVTTGVLEVVEGDIITPGARHTAGTTLTLAASSETNYNFSLKVIDPVASIPNDLATISGSFTDSLTVSGVPVNIGAGGGSGNITDINAQTGPSVTITGTGSIQTITEGNVVTISGLSQVGNSRYDAHIPPASGTQYDDEFDLPVGSSPNSDVWTTFDPGSDLNTMQIEQDPSRLFISTSNNGEFVGITRTDIDDSFSWSAFTYVRPHFRSSRTAAFDNFHGIVLVEDINSPSTTNLLLCGVFIEKASAGNNVIVAGRVGVWEFDQFDDATATLQDADSSYTDNSTGGVFIKVSYNASLNRVGCFWSNDGVAWQMTALPDLDSTTSMTGFNAIGIMSRTDGETGNSASFGFFRTDDPTSGESTTAPMPAGLLAGAIEDPNFTEMTSVSGTFTESLTVSGVPVNIGAGVGGASTLQEAYDGGDGTISITDGKPFELTSSGGLVAVTGTFTEGLTVGTGSTVIADGSITTATGTFDSVTVSGVPVLIGPVDTLLSKNFSGAVVSKEGGGNQAISGSTLSEWPVEILDTDGFFDSGTNTRFTIPSGKGIKKIRLTVCVQILADTTPSTTTYASIFIPKNGIDMVPSISWRFPHVFVAGLNVVNPSVTYPIDVEDGDYFELFVSSNAPGSPTIWNIRSYWAIEVVERDTPFELGEVVAVSGTFSESLTISGVPVATGTVGGGGSALTIRTPDSAPSVSDVSEIVVASGSLYDDGAGQVTIGPLPHLFAMKQLSGSTFAITTGFNIIVAWDLVVEDTDGREGTSGLIAGQDGFTIPEHLTNSWWVAKAQVAWDSAADTNFRTITIFGPPNHRPRHQFTNANTGDARFQSVVSAPFMAPAGTHIRVGLTHNTGTDKDILTNGPGGGATSWFSLERVGVSGTI